MDNVSVIRNHVNVIHNTSLSMVYDLIRDPASPHRSHIEEVRQLIANGSVQAADELKAKLMGFTVSGIFNKRRDKKNLTAYSGMLALDVDDLQPKEVNQVVDRAKALPNTYMVFISPSGLGVKIIVKVNSGAEYHESAYPQVVDYYKSEIGEITGKFDEKTKDVARQTFISYDPGAYLNEDCIEFVVDTTKMVTPKVKAGELGPHGLLSESKYGKAFKAAERYTKQGQAFEQSNRNNYIYQLACNANRYGIAVEYTVEKSIEVYEEDGFDTKEIQTIIYSAYKGKENETGIWKNLIDRSYNNLKKVEPINQDAQVDDDEADNSPLIPMDVIDRLPDVIQRIAKMHSVPRERDVFVVGALTILSGCLGDTKGIYDGRFIYPNLYSFIIAPASSGKGVLSTARDLGNDLHQKMSDKSEAEKKEYLLAMELYKEAKRKGEKDLKKPEKPPFKMLYAQGNSSSAVLYEQLNDCKGRCIFCETEADTINICMKNDWGNYSDLMRRAYHHEPVGLRRKTDDLIINVECPRLSMGLSGTVSQVQQFIQSVENGLFSRFIFYRFNAARIWRDVSPANGKAQLPEVVKAASKKVTGMEEFLSLYPSDFDLTVLQWEKLNNRFADMLKEISCFVTEDASATVMRLGTVTYRLAMILTAINKFEGKVKDRKLVCSDEHFDMSLSLMDVFLQHALIMYKELPSSDSGTNSLAGKLKRFYDLLPLLFDRKTAIEVIEKSSLNISDNTVDKYLKRLLNYSYLVKTEYNEYRKLAAENGSAVEQPPVIGSDEKTKAA
jgi:hypothetical protein